MDAKTKRAVADALLSAAAALEARGRSQGLSLIYAPTFRLLRDGKPVEDMSFDSFKEARDALRKAGLLLSKKTMRGGVMTWPVLQDVKR